jgi:predicted XRE-type DNA-binding protein
MKNLKTKEELVEWIETIYLQNTNGRETENEMFRLGIEAAIEEAIKLNLLNRDIIKRSIFDDIIFRKKNRDWLKISCDIAFKVLKEINNNNISKFELANHMGISYDRLKNILRGKEDLSISQIVKLSKILNIELI